MHDEADDSRVEVSDKEKPDTATDEAEKFNFIVAADAAGKAIRDLFMEAYDEYAGRHNNEST